MAQAEQARMVEVRCRDCGRLLFKADATATVRLALRSQEPAVRARTVGAGGIRHTICDLRSDSVD